MRWEASSNAYLLCPDRTFQTLSLPDYHLQSSCQQIWRKNNPWEIHLPLPISILLLLQRTHGPQHPLHTHTHTERERERERISNHSVKQYTNFRLLNEFAVFIVYNFAENHEHVWSINTQKIVINCVLVCVCVCVCVWFLNISSSVAYSQLKYKRRFVEFPSWHSRKESD